MGGVPPMDAPSDAAAPHAGGKRGLRRWLLCATLARSEAPRSCWGAGVLWLNWQRRGDFQHLVRDTRENETRLGWAHVQADTLAAHESLVDAFFATPWLSFDAFIAEPNFPEDSGSDGATQRRAFEDFLHAQIAERLRAEPDEPQPVRIWLDAQHSGYESRKQATTAMEDHVLRPVFGRLRPCDKAIPHRLERTQGLELANLLLEALRAAWTRTTLGGPRRAVQARLANHLGWADLCTTSRPGETKFNVRLGAPQERSRRATQLPLFALPPSSRRPVISP